MEQITWGWLIVIYLFLGGLGAGSYLTSSLAYKGYFDEDTKLDSKFYNLGFIFAPILVIIGCVMLLFDLAPSAALNPFMLIQLYLHPISMMGIGMYLLTIFIIISLITAFYVLKKKNLNSGLLMIGSVLSFGVMCYTGLLLYVVKAIPLWATIWLPILFTLSAFSTGLSFNSLTLVVGGSTLSKKISKAHALIISLEIGAFVFFIAHALSSAAGRLSVANVLFGQYSVVFWVGFVIVGLLFPLFMNVKEYYTSSEEQAGLSVNKNLSLVLSCANEAFVLIGGFILRFIVVFGAISIIL